MKVKQLIMELQKLSPELLVVVRGYEDGVNDISKLIEVNLERDYYESSYMGAHDKVRRVSDTSVKAIELYGSNGKDY